MTVRVTFTLLDGPLHLHSVVCSGAGLHFVGVHRKTIFIKTNLNPSVDILDLTCPNILYRFLQRPSSRHADIAALSTRLSCVYIYLL